MIARTRLRIAAVGVPALLATLAFGVTPTLATEVEIDEQSIGPSSLEVDDTDNNRDIVTVTISAANVVVVDTGPGGVSPDGADCTAVNAVMVTCPLDPPDDPPPAEPFNPIGIVDYDGEEGDDEFTISAPLAGSDLEAGPGNDTLIGNELDDDLEGEAGNDQVIGNGGSDSVEGMEGNDTLLGGEGDDSLDDGGTGTDTGGTDLLDGGPGRDEADYGSREAAVSLTFDGLANDGFPGEGDNLVAIERASSGEGDDTLVGDGGPNVFFSGSGSDIIRALAGRDEIDAEDGDDTVSGGAGTDGIVCGSGLDTAVIDPDDIFDLGGSGSLGGMQIVRTTESFDCERTGAGIGAFATATIKKGIAKVPVSCGADEAATCEGKVKLLVNGKSIGKGKFKVPVGKTKKSKVKLSKSGMKTLKRFGGEALAAAQVATKLAGETSVSESDVLVG